MSINLIEELKCQIKRLTFNVLLIAIYFRICFSQFKNSKRKYLKYNYVTLVCFKY